MDERASLGKRPDNDNDDFTMDAAAPSGRIQNDIDGSSYTASAQSSAIPDSATDSQHQDIRDDIEDTRTEMGDTIDEIQERLNPETLMNQAKDSARDATIGRAERMVNDAGDSARDAGSSMLETIKQNPVPMAMVAFGVGWLWTHRQSASSANRRDYGRRTGYYGVYDTDARYRTDDRWRYPNYDQQSTGDSMRQTASNVQDRAGRAASQVQDQAGQMVSQAQDQVGEWSDQAQDQMSRWGDQAQTQMSTWGNQAQDQLGRVIDEFDHLLQENPLGVATVALGLGAAAGLMVPETQQENRLMGEKRDQMLDQAQGMAQDTMEKVQQVAGKAQEAAQQEAKDQGLTSSGD